VSDQDCKDAEVRRTNTKNANSPALRQGYLFIQNKSGDDLLSQEVYLQVPSARMGLTAVFEMGTGVTPSLWSPEICSHLGITPKDFRASTSKIQALGRLVPVG
jgi:hypothetical protein